MSLPPSGHALNRIEQALVAEDPRLGSQFAFFTRLARHEPMPEIEQLPDRRQRMMRRAMLLPLLAVSLAALLAASWLTSSRAACPAGPSEAASSSSVLSQAAHCQPSPTIRLDTMPMH
jgi:hypothetical protein